MNVNNGQRREVIALISLNRSRGVDRRISRERERGLFMDCVLSAVPVFEHTPFVVSSIRMGTKELKTNCALDEPTLELLKMVMTESKLSARAI